MSNTATLATRVDPFIKAQSTSIVEGLGFDMPSVIRAFVTQIYLQKRIPLDLAYPENVEIPKATSEAIEWAKDYDAKPTKRHLKNASQLFDEIGV